MAAPSTTLPKMATDNRLRPALSSRVRPARPSAFSASITFGWRALLKIKHIPFQLFDATIFPIMMTLMFTYLFGGALAESVGSYLHFLLPGIMVQAVVLISMYTAIAVNTDISKGIFDRFRSLAFWRPAVLVGALLGDMVRYTLAASVVIILGLILGFRPDGGVIGVISAVGLLLFFAFSLSWLWTMFGFLLPNPEAVMMTCGFASFPLSFASNIFVDPATMPAGLRFFVNLNPISYAATATRGLMHGTATPEQILSALLASVILMAIFGPLTMYFFRNKNAH